MNISFARVIRLLGRAGQHSAGRRTLQPPRRYPIPIPVQLVHCLNENLTRLPEIQNAKKTAPLRGIAGGCTHKWNAENRTMGLEMRYDLIRPALSKLAKSGGGVLRQAFKTAGSLFTVFYEDTAGVIATYGKGREPRKMLLAEYRKSVRDYSVIEGLLTQPKPYVISMRQSEFRTQQRVPAEGRHPSAHQPPEVTGGAGGILRLPL